MGFCRTLATFGWPMSDDQLLFAVLLKVGMATYGNVRLWKYKDAELIGRLKQGFVKAAAGWLQERPLRELPPYLITVNPDKDIISF